MSFGKYRMDESRIKLLLLKPLTEVYSENVPRLIHGARLVSCVFNTIFYTELKTNIFMRCKPHEQGIR